MGEVIQLDVFGGETAMVCPLSTVEPVVLQPPPYVAPTWWVQEELPLSSE